MSNTSRRNHVKKKEWQLVLITRHKSRITSTPVCFHTRHDRRYTFLRNRCIVFSAIFNSLHNYLFDRWKFYDDFSFFFFYPIKKMVPRNIVYNMFMINSFYQIGTLFLPKGINRSELNETNWANLIHCKIYISLYSCKRKKKERIIIPII